MRLAILFRATPPTKRGSLNVEDWNPQVSGRKTPLFCNATFSMLQCSFSFVAAQLLVKSCVRTPEKRMLQCSFCSATFRKLQRFFRFLLWHVAGVGFRAAGFRTCWFYRLRWLEIFFEKLDAEIRYLPCGFKCEFGGGNRVRKKSVSMRKFKLRELKAKKLC